MSNNIVNISLNSKTDPTVNITVEDGGSISGSGELVGIVKFVATGEAGATGATGPNGQSIVEDGAVTSQKIAANSINNTHLQSGSVYGDRILSNSISNNMIVDGAITSSKIQNGTITADKISNGTINRDLLSADIVTGVQIEDGTIFAAQIANNNVVRELIQDNAVGTNEIEDDVTLNGTVTVTNLDLLGQSPARITGPTSDSLEIKSNTTIDFKNTSNTTIASLDQNGNLTITGTVDGVNVGVDVAANTAKTGITTSQSNAIVANTAKETNVTTSLSYEANGSKLRVNSSDGEGVDLPASTTSSWGVMTNDMFNKLDGVSIGAEVNVNPDWNSTSGDSEILNKPSLLQLGTTSTTALAGDTALLQLGTSGTTALAGDTTTISGAQASAITANTAKTGITTSQADAITANTAKPDLTVDGAGTINANNVPTLNQNTTGNAATATALAAGNQTIDGDVNIGASQAGHDFTLHGATTQFANIVWDASMNFLKVADASKIVFGNGAAAVDFDSSIQANGSNLVIYNDTGNVQIGDTVEITGDLTVTGTVDGIDIATDVAANTAKTSFPGFGTTAGTALEGDTVIPAAYTDAEAVSAVAAADDYIKNDANEVLAGNFQINSELYIVNTAGDNSKSRIRNTSTTGNRTIELPDHDGNLATTNKWIDCKTAGYWASTTTGGFYITLGGSSSSENTSLSTASYSLMYIAPYDGKILRISSFHQQATSGTSTFEMYIDGDDSDLTNDQRGSDMTTSSYTRKFTEDCPTDWTFSKGEAIAIKRTDSAARYGVTMTIVFEYDTTT